MKFLEKIKAILGPLKSLVWISLAAWVTHVILRVLFLFRNDPYGFPFVSKPDWYIFHAVCIDFLWICNALVIFTAIAGLLYFLINRKGEGKGGIVIKTTVILYAVFHSLIFVFTLLDDEMQRFLGSHISYGLLNTYKDTSSLAMLWDYVENDLCVPYLQFFVLALMIPFTYGVYRLLKWKAISVKKTLIGMLIFYVASYLFIYFIWTGNARMTKLRPIVSIAWNEIVLRSHNEPLSEKNLAQYATTYQNLWQAIEGDSLWTFAKPGEASTPLFRTPNEPLLQSEQLSAQREKKPNFIVVFMESERALDVGFLNPGTPSATPFLDSLAAHSRIWERMHTSGLPTTGGVLSTHTGIPHHSKLAEATDLAHVNIPSYASYLKDAGYEAHYFSAADPAWDNLGTWMSKWYTAQHYDRHREDDSTFFEHATSYIVDTLGKMGKPFVATLMSRSNHYPFNFAAGMTAEQKELPLPERIRVTMGYTDRQVARLIHAAEKEEWYQNTYVIVMADHGFPLGENDVSTMNGGAFSNATWIPFILHGEGIEPSRDTSTAGQLDIAPTIMELAGYAVPNMFMGHNLLRGYGSGLSLGAYANHAAIGYDGYRLIQKQPTGTGPVTGLFQESDTHQNNNLLDKIPEREKHMTELLDTLIKISDYSLERGM